MLNLLSSTGTGFMDATSNDRGIEAPACKRAWAAAGQIKQAVSALLESNRFSLPCILHPTTQTKHTGQGEPVLHSPGERG